MTVSVWVKSNTGVAQSFRMTANSGTQTSPFLIADTSWTRVSWSFVSSSNGNILFPFSSSALDLLVYGFQVETGDIATDYIPTTTAAVSVGPVSGLPRLDYYDSTCPKLLLEPQRSNLVRYSEQIDNAYWVKTASSVNANNAVSPDGYTNADQWVGNGTSGQHILRHTYFAATALATFSYSFYVKADGITKMGYREDAQTGRNGAFNIATKTTIFTTSGDTISFQDAANGFVRVTIISVVGSNGTLGMQLFLLDDAYTTGNPNSYSSNVSASEGVLLYGAQIEIGAYATSYIPTLGASVTRVADAASKTGISSLIGQTEGTLFVEFKKEHDGLEAISINNGSTTDRVYMGFNGSVFISQVRSGGGAAQASFTTALTNNQTYKCALAYKLNDFVLYINGVQIGTDNSGIVPVGMSDFSFNASTNVDAPFFSPFNQALLFKTRLSNESLAELTSL
jgi:hypothetical protein